MDEVYKQDLEAAAKEATEGPWSFNGNCRNGVWQPAGKFYVFETGCRVDAVFTALANPAAILEILAENKKLTEQVAELNEQVEHLSEQMQPPH